jgi:hypothetical protein
MGSKVTEIVAGERMRTTGVVPVGAVGETAAGGSAESCRSEAEGKASGHGKTRDEMTLQVGSLLERSLQYRCTGREVTASPNRPSSWLTFLMSGRACWARPQAAKRHSSTSGPLRDGNTCLFLLPFPNLRPRLPLRINLVFEDTRRRI